MKSSNIGGQAVLEGIMMKHKDEYAVAVRKPDGEIIVEKDTYRSIVGNAKKLTQIPFIRGIFNFIDSMVLGIKTLTFSASFFEEEEEQKELTQEETEKQEKMEKVEIVLFDKECYSTGQKLTKHLMRERLFHQSRWLVLYAL